jgi:hypothetical protein
MLRRSTDRRVASLTVLDKSKRVRILGGSCQWALRVE